MGNNQTYTPMPVDTSNVKLPEEIDRLRNDLAKNTHEVWAAGRIKEGVTYGEAKDGEKKNPLLKPYKEMNREERQSDVDTVTEAIKFVYAAGYKIRPMESWEKEESGNYTALYNDSKGKPVKPPLYRAPMVVGLIAQDDAAPVSEKKVVSSFDNFLAYLGDKLGENIATGDNDKRATPIYILTKLGNDIEKNLAAHASKKYGIGILPAASDEYMIDHCCMLLAVWDGVSVAAGTGAVVRRALRESEDSARPADFDIHDVCPVFQIILPSDKLSAMEKKVKGLEYKIRPIHPYVLEWGDDWYCIDGLGYESISPDVKKFEMIDIRKSTLIEDAERELNDEKRNNISKLKENKKKELGSIPEKMSGTMARSERKRVIRDTRRRIKKEKQRVKNIIRYNERITSDLFKGRMLEENLEKIRFVNRYIASDINKKKGKYYSQTEGFRGKKRSVDAVNVRHMRIDGIATKLQEKDRLLMIILSGAAIGAFVGYGLFSDFANPHSSLGVIGALLTTVAIICAVIVYSRNKAKGYHAGHTDLRLLSEMLRTKVYLNAADFEDKDVGEYFSERQKMNVGWARIVCRGWDAVDMAEGIYNTAGNESIGLDAVLKKWIGSEDKIEEKKALKYKPSNDGQLEYFRNSGGKYEGYAQKHELIEEWASPIVAIAMIIISAFVAVLFFRSGGNILKLGVDSQFDFGSVGSILEAVAIFVIGLVPAVVACVFLYHSTRRYSETVKRYKWLALKYQKLIRCFENAKDDDVRRDIIEEAARVSIEEISQWTELTSQSDAKLPF